MSLRLRKAGQKPSIPPLQLPQDPPKTPQKLQHNYRYSSKLFPEIQQLENRFKNPPRNKRRFKTDFYHQLPERNTATLNMERDSHQRNDIPKRFSKVCQTQLITPKKGNIKKSYELKRIWKQKQSSHKEEFHLFAAKEMINSCRLTSKGPVQSLNRVAKVIDAMEKSLYNYQAIEKELIMLNIAVDQLKSGTISFQSYVFSGMLTFHYYSYTLSVFYFDKALRYLNERTPLKYREQIDLQLRVYNTVARMLLRTGYKQEARQFAYTYLRKLWKLAYYEEELSAYDLLGQIQSELQNCTLSKYFHHRMCTGQTERGDFVRLSNLAFSKSQKQRLQLTSFQNINEFVRFDKPFNALLLDHFLSTAQQTEQFRQTKKKRKVRKIMLTHKSPNRITKNYHKLERNLMRQKSSKQLYFVSKAEVNRLKKVLVQYGDFITSIKVSIAFLENISRYSLPTRL